MAASEFPFVSVQSFNVLHTITSCSFGPQVTSLKDWELLGFSFPLVLSEFLQDLPHKQRNQQCNQRQFNALSVFSENGLETTLVLKRKTTSGSFTGVYNGSSPHYQSHNFFQCTEVPSLTKKLPFFFWTRDVQKYFYDTIVMVGKYTVIYSLDMVTMTSGGWTSPKSFLLIQEVKSGSRNIANSALPSEQISTDQNWLKGVGLKYLNYKNTKD